MPHTTTFGRWLSAHRHLLDLTQDELVRQVGCSVVTIRKLEADARRPSKPIAERLAGVLELRADERTLFLQIARGLASADRLPPPIPGGAAGSALPTLTPPALPSGTVTFLFTDIEGSTQLWEQHPQAMQLALARHDAIMRQAIAAAAGVVYKVIGDAFQAAFPTAPAACAAALAAQRALAGEAWGVIGAVPVRMALHTCAAVPEDGDYRTGALNRLGRLLGVVHGEQIVLSRSTADLARETLPPDVTLRDLGERQLRDLRPEPIFQLVAPDLPSDFPPLKTLDYHPHNLPTQPTPLIGREKEIVTVCSVLRRADARLVTLTGPGGMGKTRLALQIAAALLDAFADGVWFVNLAPLSDPALVATTIAQTLRVRERAGQTMRDALHEYLREKRLLLLLDNCEQVAAAAPLVGELLAGAPGLQALATSRMPLHLAGEREIAVVPLALPPMDDRRPTTDDQSRDLAVGGQSAVVGQYAAVQLFSVRAQAVKADFALTTANAPAVAAICYRLDGLPLAIELAAARVKLLPPQALLVRLESRLKLLTGGARDRPARQQTIRAAIDWSYALLNVGEQMLFRRLGVFVGGCTLVAAEAICNADQDLPLDMLDGMAALLDQSLVKQEIEAEGEPRFGMLETIREYALERLAAAGELDSLLRQHAEYFLRFAETADPELIGLHEVEWLDRVEQEHDNLRAVLQQALHPDATSDEKERALRLAGAVRWLWRKRGYYVEGLRWYDALLAATKDLPSIAGEVRARALRGAGRMALDMASGGNPTRGKELFEEARALSQQAGDKAGLAEALNNLGWVPVLAGDPGSGIPLFEQSLALYRELGDTRGIASALYTLAFAARDLGDDEHAAALLVESQPLFRSVDDTGGLAWSYWLLGQILHDKGEHPRAAALFGEGERLFRKLGEKWGLSLTLEWVAISAMALGDYAHAEMFSSEAAEIDREIADRYALANALHNLANALRLQGQFEQSRTRLDESLTISRELEDNVTIGWGLHTLAKVARDQGDGTQAITLFEESLSVFRTVGDRSGIPWNLVRLGLTAQQQGDQARAEPLLKEALLLFQKSGLRGGFSLCLAGLAGVAARRQSAASARRAAGLLAGSAVLNESSGSVPEPFERAYLERTTAAARAQLGEAAFASAWAAGRDMTLEQMIAYALESSEL